MRNSYHLLIGIMLLLSVQACTERMICPAYQSAFIHDEEELRKRFSYFTEDSMPKVLEASKNKYLLIEPISYRRKLRSLQTIPMRDIYPVEEDSLAFDDEFALAERDAVTRDLYDSADLVKEHSIETKPVDSTYVISLKKEKFNIDQELYLWYLRKYLVYPDVRLQMEDVDLQKKDAVKKEKKGILGFFKNLFKKKKKEDELEEGSERDPKIQNGPETSATELDEGAEEKKGFFSFLKKGNKAPKEKKPKVKKEKKKKNKEEDEPPPELEPEEEEDDGEDDF